MTLCSDKSGIWFALNYDGVLHYLGNCGDFEAAEASSEDLGVNPIWIINEEEARQWLECLSILTVTNNQIKRRR